MNTESALNFLLEHQPMPDDSELTEDLIGRYDEVRKHFIANPDPRCVPLFLESFGAGDGFGVYQLVEDVFRRIDPDTVADALKRSLTHSRRPVRYWSAQIAAAFPSVVFCAPLVDMLSSGDEDERSAAAIALGQIQDARAIEALTRAEAAEKDPQMQVLLRELLGKA